MLEFPAIAIRHRRENVFAVARKLERDLGDWWKLFAERIRVVGVRRAELVEVNLLIKIQISIGPLAFSWKARVINSRSIGVPCRAAPRSGILNMRNGVHQWFARRDFVKVKCAVFAATFGKRHGYTFAIQ